MGGFSGRPARKLSNHSLYMQFTCSASSTPTAAQGLALPITLFAPVALLVRASLVQCFPVHTSDTTSTSRL